MKYVQPVGGLANDPYIDANPAIGVEGSAVPAAAIEHPMREILAVITAAGIAPSEANLTQLLTALRSTGLFQTPAQFDNTTKAATTEFVQRALGSLSGTRLVTTETLTAADVGRLITLNTSSTVTMPLANSVPVGSAITIQANNSGVVVSVRRNGADTFGAGSTASTADIVIGGGDALTLVSVGGTIWYPVGGAGALKASTGVFGSSIGTSGYQKLPSGLIIQWASITTTTGGAFTWTFPIAFPNAKLSEAVGLMPGNYTTTATGGGSTNRSGTLIVANTGAAAGAGISFQMIAIGN